MYIELEGYLRYTSTRILGPTSRPGVFRPIYRTPPFDKGKLLFPFGEKGGENRPPSLSFVSLKCAFW